MKDWEVNTINGYETVTAKYCAVNDNGDLLFLDSVNELQLPERTTIYRAYAAGQWKTVRVI